MKQLLLFIFILTTFNLYSQRMKIITLDKTQIEATLLDEATKKLLLHEFDGKQNNAFRKMWTARTFVLSDGKIIIGFYDKQAVLIKNLDDFRKIDRVRFVKNDIDFLKKNISYKIQLHFDEGNAIVLRENPRKLDYLKSEMPEYYDFEVYKLNTGQILFIDKSENLKCATIYENLKALSSENNRIAHLVYDSEDDEHLM